MSDRHERGEETLDREEVQDIAEGLVSTPYQVGGKEALLAHDAALRERVAELEEALRDARFAAWVAGCDHTRLRETPDRDAEGREAAKILARLADEYTPETGEDGDG